MVVKQLKNLVQDVFAKFAAKPMERKVTNYTLPDPLNDLNGGIITTKEEWITRGRKEVLELFKEHVYGNFPEKPKDTPFTVLSSDENALNGKATRKEIKINILGNSFEGKEHNIILLLYIPNDRDTSKKVPAFLGFNFFGNHTIQDDPNISVTKNWVRNNVEFHIKNNTATDASRAVRNDRWPSEYIVEHGYALGTIYYGDIVPDHNDGLKEGIPKYYSNQFTHKKNRSLNEWGAISAWAWGLSRTLDYFFLEEQLDIDPNRVAVIGHSRLGKTSLWAGSINERFAIAISNCSGCGGAAISRRRVGETIKRINKGFPHWFALKFREYNNKESELPIDQHMLVSLMAPRPVYVASASKDLWADPKGEFLSVKNATPVYDLFDLDNDELKNRIDLEYEVPILSGQIGHHIRRGRHNILIYDWANYIKFADRFLK